MCHVSHIMCHMSCVTCHVSHVRFPEGKARGKSRGAALPAKENPVLPNSFIQIYILFIIHFRIGPPKMHRQLHIVLPKIHRPFRIGPPKMHRRFRIGPPQVTLNLLLPEFRKIPVNSGKFWYTMAIMQEKQQNFLFKIELCFYPHRLRDLVSPVCGIFFISHFVSIF